MDRTKTVSLVAMLLLTVAVIGGLIHTSTEKQTITVEQHPTDDELSREDDVIVRNASQQLADDLELIVHRVDSLRGGDDQTHRLVIHVGGIEDHPTIVVPSGGSFGKIDSQAVSMLGFREQSSDGETLALALTSSPPGSRNVSIYLPTVSRIASMDGISFEFVLAHELGGIPLWNRDALERERNVTRQITTDYILARQAISEGIATKVGVEYTKMYGGNVDPSVLRPDGEDWRSRSMSAVYFEGYQYSSVKNLDSSIDAIDVNSTAAILHPNDNISVSNRPEEPFGEEFRERYDRVYSDRVGELLIRELLVSRGVTKQTAAAAAAGWRNGRLDRYAGGGRTATAWTTVWENQTERRAFVDTYGRAVTVERVDEFDTTLCDSSTRYLLVDGNRVTVFRCN